VIAPDAVLELDGRPASRRSILGDAWRHRHVLAMLARADFHVRYKRASFGVVWAVVVPLIQAAVLAVVFSHFVKVGGGVSYGAYVMSGVMAWGYFSATLGVGATAIVEGSSLTDKVWFPRALLPIVPVLANLPSLGVSMVALVVALPFLGVSLAPRVALLVPACILLIVFTMALSLVLSALHVYFRDVRYLVAAGLLLWFYVTPVIFPVDALGELHTLIEVNPMTGVIAVFHAATVGAEPHWLRQLLVSLGVALALIVIAIEAYRRHDRLFVDQL
jgi:ABC-type polysaccharide/polyol phosphate export permease